jgi:hypothetical protein
VPTSISRTNTRTTGPFRLIVVRKHGKRLEPYHVGVTQRVGHAIRAMCAECVNRVVSSTPRDYDPDAGLELDEYFVLKRTDLEADHPVLAALDSSGSAPLLTAQLLSGKTFWFYAIVFGGEASGRTSFLRKSNPHYIAKHGNLFTLLGDDLRTLEEPLFTFDDRFDAIITPANIFVPHQNGFEQLFRDADFIASHVSDWVRGITDHLPLDEDGANALAAAAQSDSRISRRLRTIFARGHLANVTIQRLRREIVSQGLDPQRFIANGRLTFNWDDRYDLLGILNEDLFTGGLSGIHYRVDRKEARR